jgi:hypothetical protein
VSKHEKAYIKQDLFPLGQAQRNAVFAPYPGGGGPYSPSPVEGNFPVPVQQPQSLGPLNQLPLKDISALIDRMGGIEGIMNTVNKVSVIMKNIQQMAPMIKLLLGSFGAKAQTADWELDDAPVHKPKKRRKRRRSARRRYGKPAGIAKIKSLNRISR